MWMRKAATNNASDSSGGKTSNTAILAVPSGGHPCPQDSGCRLEACRTEQARMPVLQHVVPFALIFEHDLAEQTNRWHAVVEQFVMEFL